MKMLNRLQKWARQSFLKGEIDAIKTKILVPGPLARVDGWRANLEHQLAVKEDELWRLENEQ